MSRSGYSDDCSEWDLIRWRGAVKSAMHGKRGQRALKELLSALDALETKELIEGELSENGAVCALGALALYKNIPIDGLDSYDRDAVARAFNIAPALAAEIMFLNDGGLAYQTTPERRFNLMRVWVEQHIKSEESSA